MNIHKDLVNVILEGRNERTDRCQVHSCFKMLSPLIQGKIWEPPRVFFDSSLNTGAAQKLMEIVRRHQV